MTIEQAKKKANKFNSLVPEGSRASYAAVGEGHDCRVFQYLDNDFVGVAAY